MPISTIEVGAFEKARGKVSAWLRLNFVAKSLRASDLERFQPRRIVSGWRIQGLNEELFLLLPQNFPYSACRIAFPKHRFLVWPHIEADGIVCLPQFDFDSENPIDNARYAVHLGIKFLSERDPVEDKAEFEREFVSYWSH